MKGGGLSEDELDETHPGETLVLDVDVRARPASSATAHEWAWRGAVTMACESGVRPGYDPAVSRFAVEIEYRTPLPKRAGEWWDLDNLIKPTLDAMASVFGAREWRGAPQAADDRVDRIAASKRTARRGEEPGARIRVWTVPGPAKEEDPLSRLPCQGMLRAGSSSSGSVMPRLFLSVEAPEMR